MSTSVVVTGCGSGIGRAIIERLAADGYAAVGVESDAAKAAVVDEALGSSGTVVTGDVRERRTLKDAAARAVELAPLSGWVNNVGVALSGMLHQADEDDVAAVINVNLMSHFWGSALRWRPSSPTARRE